MQFQLLLSFTLFAEQKLSSLVLHAKRCHNTIIGFLQTLGFCMELGSLITI